MYLLDGFQSLVMNKIISKIFVTDFSDFLMKFWEISKNALILSIFELEKCSFFLNRSEFRQNSIGTIISGLVRYPKAKSGIKLRKTTQWT